MEEEENTRERARAQQLLGAMRTRGADRVGITVGDLSRTLGWDFVATNACLLRQLHSGRVARMGFTPSGTTLYTLAGAMAVGPLL